MKPLFNQIKVERPKSNVFDLSHERKLSCQMGNLYPVFLEEIVPGDKFRVNTEMMIRMAPLVSPVMHRLNAYVHFFFVPNRLTFDGWEDFITGGRLGTDTTTFPTIPLNSTTGPLMQIKSLADHMGIPIMATSGQAANHAISALPFRAYQMIFNEYYRDQNLTAPVDFLTGSSVGTTQQITNLLTMRKRAWEKDYFTSALPWTQRGAAVSVPSTAVPRSTAYVTGVQTIETGHAVSTTAVSGTLGMLADPHGPLSVDAIESINMTVNDLRRATKLQQWLERNARAGGRYIEQILAHFGVKSSDARLQRPEYLGGNKLPIVISEVLQTADTVNNPTGRMAGHGLTVGSGHIFQNTFEEHGFVIGIMSVLPRTAYHQGLPRLFSKIDKFDYFFPEFAHLGEQEVKAKELYYNPVESTTVNDAAFGYQSRYAEYKFGRDSVHGDFRTTLNFWHMGRVFGSRPSLNESFVTSDPTDRVFAVTGSATDNMYVQMYHDVRAIRLMPVFGTPSL